MTKRLRIAELEIDRLHAKVEKLEKLLEKKFEMRTCSHCGDWITKYNTMVAGEYICDKCLQEHVELLDEEVQDGAREQIGRRLCRRRDWGQLTQAFIDKYRNEIRKYSR